MPLQPHSLFHAPREAEQSTLAAHLQTGSCNVQPMAASIVQLRQLHEGLHLLSPPTADNGCGEKLCYLAHCLPHLRQAALSEACHVTRVNAVQRSIVCRDISWQAMDTPELLAGGIVRQSEADPCRNHALWAEQRTLYLSCLGCTLHLVRQEGSVRIFDNGRQSSCR